MTKLIKKPDFQNLSDDEQYQIVYNTQLLVKRYERLVEDLVVWRRDSKPYNQALKELKDLVSETGGYQL